ncbi:hypothetical protein PsAD37_03836 [Pseudovibrio sp. Ad37]|nr:hypothetical protein PsAD37_03836 [Pseudovibrio sp. Ad37]
MRASKFCSMHQKQIQKSLQLRKGQLCNFLICSGRVAIFGKGKGSFRPPIRSLRDFENGPEPDGQSFPGLFQFKLQFKSHLAYHLLYLGFATVGAPNSSDYADWLALLLRKEGGFQYSKLCANFTLQQNQLCEPLPPILWGEVLQMFGMTGANCPAAPRMTQLLNYSHCQSLSLNCCYHN